MHKTTFDAYVALKECYYIYDVGSAMSDTPYYYIIVENDVPGYVESDEILPDDVAATVFKMEEWYQLWRKNDLKLWICAFLPRKYIVKEYIKMLVAFDEQKLKLNLRDLHDSLKFMASVHSNPAIVSRIKFEDLAALILYNQILISHKIANFNKIKDLYSKYQEADLEEKDDIYKDTFAYENKTLGLHE